MLVSAQMSTRELLEELLAQRILLLDGSMGANLQTRPLDLHKDWCGCENAYAANDPKQALEWRGQGTILRAARHSGPAQTLMNV